VDPATRAVYEASAEAWAERRPARHREAAAGFARRCLPGRPAVDLGSGPGSYFDDLGRPLVALDGARAMLELARGRDPGVPLVQADLTALPFRRGSLGGAWARASYLHLPRTALPAALAHLHGALAPSAPVELTWRAGQGEGPLPGDDFPGRFFAHWEEPDLRDVVHGAGFDIDGLERHGEWLTLRGRRARTLPDFVGGGMRILVCGLNPSVRSADAGFGFAGPNNRFWGAALASGLIPASAHRRPLAALADGIGMTDLVKRATARASELSRAEYRDGAARVSRLIAWMQPRLCLFVGLEGWRVAVDPAARPGRQPEPFSGAVAWVMPSTSGLNARSSAEELATHMAEAAALAQRLRPGSRARGRRRG